MRLIPLCLAGLLIAVSLTSCGHDSSPSTPLVTGRSITTRPNSQGQDVGSLPVNMILSPDGKYAITTDAGFREALWSIGTVNGHGVSNVPYVNRRGRFGGGETSLGERPAGERSQSAYGLYYGLAIAPDGTLYASQGAYDTVAVLKLDGEGKLTAQGEIRTKACDFPAGVALDGRGMLYVANQSLNFANPYDAAGSVAIYDRKDGKEIGRYRFTESFGGTSNYPLAIAALASGDKAFVASERDSAVYALDTRKPADMRVIDKINVGALPEAMLLNHDGSVLFVANADSDTVSVIDTASDKVLSTIVMRPPIAADLPGCSPVGLALNHAGDRLFVALGDFNAVAVVQVGTLGKRLAPLTAQLSGGVPVPADLPMEPRVEGYIPTGWYPTGAAVTPDDKHLLIADAKGIKQRLPNVHLDPRTGQHRQIGSPLNLPEGFVERIAIPDSAKLAADSERVMHDNRLDSPALLKKNPLADMGRRSGKITHIIYIIKENRTYDQVLGDLPRGNGEADLCLFGREVTPNQHALAERFVLFDNLYACGEVSGDGWCWSTEAIANANAIRNVPYNYSHRGRKFDFEGQNNGLPTGGFPATDPEGKPLTTQPIFKGGSAAPMPDVCEPASGHIWDLCTSHHVSFRNYGFYGYFGDEGAGVVGGPDNFPSAIGLQPAGHDLAGRSDYDFRRFFMDYADSDAPEIYFKQTGDKNCLYPQRTYGKYNAPSRFAEWNREFQLMLKREVSYAMRTPKRDTSGDSVPAVMFLRVPHDHTVGAQSGAHSPRSEVADNDYAVGQFVEAISHSPIWPHCAIFVIEDDAQSGGDHVDCHRTTGFVISPYIKAHSVDHGFHNTNSFLRTMELLLDLPPMTQYDATATPVLGWTRSPTNAEPYAAILPPRQIIAEINPNVSDLRSGDPRYDMAKASDAMDFTHADAAPAQDLNAIVWKTVKGVNSQPPEPRNSCMFYRRRKADDDGDDD